MNTSATQNLEVQTMMCRFHNNEIITAVNLNQSITGNATHMCNKCLVDKTNDNKILTIMEAKEQITSYKKQQSQRRKNEIEIILTQLQNLFKNIEQFKCKFNTILQKISIELQTQITLKSQELSLSENYLTQSNFWEDVKLLQEFISKPEDQMEFYYINEMQSQFQKVSDDIDYLQTIEAFENAKKIITNFHMENQIQLEPPKLENNTKTLSLSTLCKDHHKEIVLIDIDSENLQTEKRLACVRCKSNGSSQKLKTVQEIDELWNQKKQKVYQDKIANQQKSKKQIKQQKLNQQISQISKNYYQQLNLITQANFFQPITQICKTSKIKQTTIQQLSYEELLQVVDDLVQLDKEMVTLDDYKITKDMESKLEKIKYDFQLDIQKSINYLNDQSSDRQILEIKEQLQKIQAISNIQLEQQIRIQEFVKQKQGNQLKGESNYGIINLNEVIIGMQ
ncbi:unnamed protein product [Paramecium octaurelia]|uniref:Uncharacterized protein n=1 Tax=Paramecium octaurelia TaxID=43137 RepID=A0A8S1YNT0_PAROT|nr:unnamed protein product [Paramecium octaurelia]CAD8215500.1 unnamed protein product [Paramecium octaurelia]